MFATTLASQGVGLNGIVFGDRLSSRARRNLYEQHRLTADLYPDD